MLINYKYSFSQNVIPNYSFEDLKNNHADKPTLQDHLQYLDQWENLNTITPMIVLEPLWFLRMKVKSPMPICFT